MGVWKRWSFIRQFKLNVLRFIRLRGTPDEIAKGFALGIFIGLTPTLGLQMIIAIAFAILLRENKLAAALGVWITNPLTAPFIYALEYETGRLLTGMSRAHFPSELTFSALKMMGWEVLLPLSVGSLIYGIILTPLAYALTLRLIPLLKTCRISRWPRPRK
jgi:uncharacterized protein (DUF2062 family)